VHAQPDDRILDLLQLRSAARRLALQLGHLLHAAAVHEALQRSARQAEHAARGKMDCSALGTALLRWR
tara:strand:- start:96 stop:299 length:204 start_codon:yes stop_codon:yes gene_type:complete